jgi:hypothetical protein|mmetsp:Transcript_1756/g.6421  ORF Transcript_1756/g.6421 Transcript_1756/m.6421 type:complete len:417 (-) Transcript_1756:113-1363(-)
MFASNACARGGVRASCDARRTRFQCAKNVSRGCSRRRVAVFARDGGANNGAREGHRKKHHYAHGKGAVETAHVECRTAIGERLGGILSSSGREAFDAAAADALKDMMNRVADITAADHDADDDGTVGRQALTSMEIEDVMYLSVVRDLAVAGGVGEARDEKRVRLMQRCQMLQDVLPKGSDDYIINLVLRVFQNISDGSRRVNGAYVVSASTLADVYAKCASFGYFLSASARRLELEQCMSSGSDSVHLSKLACPLKLMRYRILQSNLKAIEGESECLPSQPRVAGYEVPVLLRAPGGILIPGEPLTLKQYVDQMGPAARARTAQIASVEASEVLRRHVSLLFAGDRYSVMATSLPARDARRSTLGNDDEHFDDYIAIHMDQLKHTVLEASAFGTALADVERDIDCSSHAQLLTRA